MRLARDILMSRLAIAAPVKIITTAEGGMALTNSAELANQMSLLRSHGITRDASLMSHTPDGPWYYQQIELGFNYRMTEIQAALGLSQLQRLREYVSRRHALARRYDEKLAGFPLVLPWQLPGTYSSLHLYPVRIWTGVGLRGHADVFRSLREAGIGVNLHYIPVHTHPYYQRLGFSRGDYPQAEAYYAEAISLPLYQGLEDNQQDEVIEAVAQALAA
jgi:dTDP-4-amino-4,6-dideoxygalactose transaminase